MAEPWAYWHQDPDEARANWRELAQALGFPVRVTSSYRIPGHPMVEGSAHHIITEAALTGVLKRAAGWPLCLPPNRPWRAWGEDEPEAWPTCAPCLNLAAKRAGLPRSGILFPSGGGNRSSISTIEGVLWGRTREAS